MTIAQMPNPLQFNSAVEPAAMLRAGSAAAPCLTDPTVAAAANFNSSAMSSPDETAAIAYSSLPAMAANLFSFAVPGFNGGETAATLTVSPAADVAADQFAGAA